MGCVKSKYDNFKMEIIFFSKKINCVGGKRGKLAERKSHSDKTDCLLHLVRLQGRIQGLLPK